LFDLVFGEHLGSSFGFSARTQAHTGACTEAHALSQVAAG